jgi:hypothetical protein
MIQFLTVQALIYIIIFLLLYLMRKPLGYSTLTAAWLAAGICIISVLELYFNS